MSFGFSRECDGDLPPVALPGDWLRLTIVTPEHIIPPQMWEAFLAARLCISGRWLLKPHDSASTVSLGLSQPWIQDEGSRKPYEWVGLPASDMEPG